MKTKFILSAVLFLGVFTFFSCRRSIPTLSGDWKKQSSFIGLQRNYATLFVIGTKAYVGTGYSPLNQTWFSDFYVYDIPTDKWSKIKDFPGEARQEAVAFASGGKGYVGTGYDGKTLNYFNDFYCYDPATNNWTKIDTLPGPKRKGAVSFVINDKGYVGTGVSVDLANRPISTQGFFKLNSRGTGWDTIAPFSGQKVYGAFSFVLNGSAYVGGGFASGTVSNFLYQYNVGSNKWFKKANLDSNLSQLPRGQAVAFVIDNLGYVATGAAQAGGNKSDAFSYDPVQDTWIQVNGFEGGFRSGCVGFAIPNGTTILGTTPGYRAYIGLGLGSFPANDDWWSFNPLVPQILNN